ERGAALGGVPLLRPGADHLAQGRCASGAVRRPRRPQGDPGGGARKAAVLRDLQQGEVRKHRPAGGGQGAHRQELADAGRRVGISVEAASQALRPDLASGRKRPSFTWLAVVPFFAYTIAFLFIPAASVMLGAFQDKHDHATFSNIRLLFNHPYIDAYWGSIRI